MQNQNIEKESSAENDETSHHTIEKNSNVENDKTEADGNTRLVLAPVGAGQNQNTNGTPTRKLQDTMVKKRNLRKDKEFSSSQFTRKRKRSMIENS